MLVIRAAQLEVFDRLASDRFAERLVRHARAEYPAVSSLSDAALRARVDAALERARGYGLTWEYTLAEFVGRDLTVSPEFDRHPDLVVALREVAASPSPDQSFMEIGLKVPAHVWNAPEAADAATG